MAQATINETHPTLMADDSSGIYWISTVGNIIAGSFDI